MTERPETMKKKELDFLRVLVNEGMADDIDIQRMCKSLTSKAEVYEVYQVLVAEGFKVNMKKMIRPPKCTTKVRLYSI